jgi:hypothetical protein
MKKVSASLENLPLAALHPSGLQKAESVFIRDRPQVEH